MAEALKLVGESAEGATRELPRNIEAEAALLGALMIDNRVAEDVQMKLRPEHFFEPVHGRIYETILKLLDRNMVASPVTLKPMLDQDAALKEHGGSAYLVQLASSGASLVQPPRRSRLRPRSEIEARRPEKKSLLMDAAL